MREEAYYSFDVTLEKGWRYELTFASQDSKATVAVRALDDATATPHKKLKHIGLTHAFSFRESTLLPNYHLM